MKKYLLIGGIGSGKSTVSKMFQEHGAMCLDLDDVGHDMLIRPEVIDMLVETFGRDILDDSGQISRPKLAQKAFATPADTVKLNAISQPRLMREAQERIEKYEKEGEKLVIIEISAFDGPDGTFAPFVRAADGIIAVVAPTAVKVERATAKGFDEKDVRNRLARQVKDEQRRLWADYSVNNKGTFDQLQEQVDDVWAKISE